MNSDSTAHSSTAQLCAAVTRNFHSERAVSHKVMPLCYSGYYWNTCENIGAWDSVVVKALR
jgi:hypothetical protein